MRTARQMQQTCSVLICELERLQTIGERFSGVACQCKQLDRVARQFFNEARNVEVCDGANSICLSETFKFYTSDFLAKKAPLAKFVNLDRLALIPENYAFDFTNYDWTINRQPGT